MANITLPDIYLRDYTLDSLPRLKLLRSESFERKPEICIERAKYVTEYLRDHDDPADGPEVRQAKKVRHFLENKAPVFHDRNLLAGSTTKKPLGAPLFPEYIALMLWPELETVSTREKNPQYLSPEDAETLNSKIFPFWMEGNILEIARKRFGNISCLKLFEQLVFFIASKAGALSHAVPSYTLMLEEGLAGICQIADSKIAQLAASGTNGANREKIDFYRAVCISLKGLTDYANRLANHAERLARLEADALAKKELNDMAAVCRRVPAQPARTFREAVNAIWISQIGIHAENINMAMSPGRLDQVLYPYYRKDMDEGRLSIAEAIELVGCLWLKLSDNVVMVPESAEEMFGGSGTSPAVTLGGVDSTGENCVNDLTYIMLRVTELLCTRDPNVNARYHYGENPPEYLARLSDVILNTKAVPAIYNDVANIAALEAQNEDLKDARDYGIIGCVELASSGKDYAASSSIMLNLVAALEMALFGGKRPITGEDQIGPATPDPAQTQLNSFQEFWNIFITQLDWLIEQAIQMNEHFGLVHQQVMPSPLLSAHFHGPLENGIDLIHGGAVYNSSGATHIGFADVVDSLNAIEWAVFEDHRYSFPQIIDALKADFSRPGDESIRVYLQHRTPKYGTEDPIALRNSQALVQHLFEIYQDHINYRNGPYRPAYWTMTNHAGLGGVIGAMPHGRKAGKVLSSGITPVSGAAPELTACLNAVATLGGRNVPGCWALNLKYTPENDQQAMATRFAQIVECFFRKGGQQIQFNIMTYEMLMDAKAHPENYKELMVRVSGYSAYFKDLNDMMKDELITRSQYDLQTRLEVPFPGGR